MWFRGGRKGWNSAGCEYEVVNYTKNKARGGSIRHNIKEVLLPKEYLYLPSQGFSSPTRDDISKSKGLYG